MTPTAAEEELKTLGGVEEAAIADPHLQSVLRRLATESAACRSASPTRISARDTTGVLPWFQATRRQSSASPSPCQSSAYPMPGWRRRPWTVRVRGGDSAPHRAQSQKASDSSQEARTSKKDRAPDNGKASTLAHEPAGLAPYLPSVRWAAQRDSLAQTLPFGSTLQPCGTCDDPLLSPG